MINLKVLRFPVLNLEEAKFDCTFGRGCDGICCRDGKPPVYAEERERLEANLERFLPLLRPDAATAIRKKGLYGKEITAGQPTLRTAGGWCVFFNGGCVLHTVGAGEGDKYRYKPAICALFPLTKESSGDHWKVRQKGYDGEIWELPCLDPEISTTPATVSLEVEVAMAQRFSADESDAGVS